MKDASKIKLSIEKWEKTLNFKEFDDFFAILCQIVDILKNFLLLNMSDYLTFMESI